jgi:hypothetical protein
MEMMKRVFFAATMLVAVAAYGQTRDIDAECKDAAHVGDLAAQSIKSENEWNARIHADVESGRRTRSTDLDAEVLKHNDIYIAAVENTLISLQFSSKNHCLA